MTANNDNVSFGEAPAAMRQSLLGALGGWGGDEPLPRFVETKQLVKQFPVMPFDAPQFSQDPHQVLPNRPVQLQAVAAGYGIYPLAGKLTLTPYQHAIAALISQSVQVKDVYISAADAALASQESLKRSRSLGRRTTTKASATAAGAGTGAGGGRHRTVPPNYNSRYANQFNFITKEIATSRSGIFTEANRLQPEDADAYVQERLASKKEITKAVDGELANLSTKPVTMNTLSEMHRLGTMKRLASTKGNEGGLNGGARQALLDTYLHSTATGVGGGVRPLASSVGSRGHALVSTQGVRAAGSGVQQLRTTKTLAAVHSGPRMHSHGSLEGGPTVLTAKTMNTLAGAMHTAGAIHTGPIHTAGAIHTGPIHTASSAHTATMAANSIRTAKTMSLPHTGSMHAGGAMRTAKSTGMASSAPSTAKSIAYRYYG